MNKRDKHHILNLCLLLFWMLAAGCLAKTNEGRVDKSSPAPEKATSSPSSTTATTMSSTVPAMALPTATEQPPLASVRFLDVRPELRRKNPFETEANARGVDFEVNGIYAFDGNNVLLFGGVYAGSPVQSSLLRTQDGGKSWIEVMQPVKGSEVIDISFVDGGLGWALVMWTYESQGEILLFGSEDDGLTWYKISKIPKTEWHGFPVQMKFYDDKYGKIDMLYFGGVPPDHVAHLETADGGVHWRETSRDTFEGATFEVKETALVDYNNRNPHPNKHEALDREGGYWRFEAPNWRMPLILTHQEPSGGRVLTYSVPTHFSYKDGKIFSVSEDDAHLSVITPLPTKRSRETVWPTPVLTATPLVATITTGEDAQKIIEGLFKNAECRIDILNTNDRNIEKPEVSIYKGGQFDYFEWEKVSEIADNPSKNLRAYVACDPVLCQDMLFLEDREQGNIYQIFWSGRIPWRPISRLTWIGDDRLIFTHRTSPHDLIIAVVDVEFENPKFILYWLISDQCK